MTKAKRILSVLLSVLMLAVSVIVAAAETTTDQTYKTASVSYAYDAAKGILTISKDKGNQKIMVKEGIMLMNDLRLPSVKKVVLDESLDKVEVIEKNSEGAVVRTRTVQEEELILFTLSPQGVKQGKKEKFFASFSFPDEIVNRSSKVMVVTFDTYYTAVNGEKITDSYFFGEDETIYDSWFVYEEGEREYVNNFNVTWGTSFTTYDECKSFLKAMDFNEDWGTSFTSWEACQAHKDANRKWFYAPTRLFCKKGSSQQKLCKFYNAPYTLLDGFITKTHSATGVKATYNNEAFSTPVSINVNKINAEKANMVAYEISPLDNAGNKVQPEEAVELCLPIPQTWSENDVQVLHTKDDNTTKEVNFVVIENQAVFYVSSFSKFTLVNTAGISANASEDPTTDHPASDPSVEKPSDEKPAPKLNFFQRIIQWFRNLFAKLFGR